MIHNYYALRLGTQNEALRNALSEAVEYMRAAALRTLNDPDRTDTAYRDAEKQAKRACEYIELSKQSIDTEIFKDSHVETLNKAIDVADNVRLQLSEDYEKNRQSVVCCPEWMRLEGAVRVVRALRMLK